MGRVGCVKRGTSHSHTGFLCNRKCDARYIGDSHADGERVPSSLHQAFTLEKAEDVEELLTLVDPFNGQHSTQSVLSVLVF